MRSAVATAPSPQLEASAASCAIARRRCAQCYLPVRGGGLVLRINGSPEPFCCYGCYLVLRVTREQGPEGQAQGIFLRLGVAMFFAMNAMMFSMATYFPYVYGGQEDAAGAAGFLLLLRVGSMVLTLPVLLLLGLPVGWQAVRDAKQWVLSTDALIALGTVAAFAVSVANTLSGAPHVYFDTVAMLLIFVAIGRYLEARGKAETADVLKRIKAAQATVLSVERGATTVDLAADQLRAGDILCLRPGDLCPADGEIILGQAQFDQASLTGESRPELKGVGDSVIAGTTDLDGHVRVRALRLGAASTLGRLQRLVEESLDDRSGLQGIADRLATVFMPFVLSLAALTFAYWWFASGSDIALLTTLSVLVVACPCAFGIATPTALWTGIGEAARRGVLLKNAAVLETLARVDTLWFDRTGTLTSGSMEFAGIVQAPEAGGSPIELLAIVRGLEAGMPHPIARALADGPAIAVADLRYHAGLGVEGRIGIRQWYFGSSAFLAQQGAPVASSVWVRDALNSLADSNPVHVLLACKSAECGSIVVRAVVSFVDPLRAVARQVVEQISGLGIKTGVLSGGTGALWQMPIGRADTHLGLLPGEKVDWITRSRVDSTVAMVGDGLNDAPALAAADVGIALGCGRDLVRDAASVSITSDNLQLVPWLLAWSRRVRRTIVQNLAWSVGYNAMALTAAATGCLNPVIAALAMIASSVAILANARRLRRYA